MVLTNTFPADALDSLVVATPGCKAEADRVVCNLGTIASGTSTTVTVHGRAHAVQARSLAIGAEIRGDSKELAPGAPNSASHTVQVTAHVLYLPVVSRPR